MSGVRCGTPSGWSQHKERGEKPCDACTTAKREYDKRWRAAPEKTQKNRLSARAQARANTRLHALYPDIYRALYEEERIKLYREAGLPVDAFGVGNGTSKRLKQPGRVEGGTE